jgi:hypothetical protein
VMTGSFHGQRALVVPLMLCPVDNHAVPLDWVLSGDAQRRMRTAAADPRACAAARNLDDLVRLLNGAMAPPWPSPPAASPGAPDPGALAGSLAGSLPGSKARAGTAPGRAFPGPSAGSAGPG